MNPSSGYGQQQEVRLCEKIIRIIGPNSTNREIRNKYKKGISRSNKRIKRASRRTQYLGADSHFAGNDIFERILWQG